jgi:uncharacterized tellurite resistance protein B-like protein
VSILEWLGLRPVARGSSSAETEAVRKIADELDQLDPDRSRYVAAFAYVLSRVAGADREISEDETRAMERIVADHGHLPEQQAVLVVRMAKSHNLLFGGTDNFLVTRELARIATHEEKVALLECLFAVSAADRSISTVEDNTIAQIAAELRLERGDVVAARRLYREHLAVLQESRRRDR